MRKAVHPAEIFAARNLRVAILRLLDQTLARLERNNRVDLRIQALDPIEIRVHHLDARDLLRLDRARQRYRVEIYNVPRIHDYVLARSHCCATSHPSSAVIRAFAPRNAASRPLALPSFARI